MRHKRHTNQIMMKILEVCKENGASKTAVVYASGLNFKTIIPYLELLTKYELLAIINEHPILYRITPKGMEALKCLKELNELMPGRFADSVSVRN